MLSLFCPCSTLYIVSMCTTFECGCKRDERGDKDEWTLLETGFKFRCHLQVFPHVCLCMCYVCVCVCVCVQPPWVSKILMQLSHFPSFSDQPDNVPVLLSSKLRLPLHLCYRWTPSTILPTVRLLWGYLTPLPILTHCLQHPHHGDVLYVWEKEEKKNRGVNVCWSDNITSFGIVTCSRTTHMHTRRLKTKFRTKYTTFAETKRAIKQQQKETRGSGRGWKTSVKV